MYRPPLIHEVERDWVKRSGEIGRWRVKVRASGARAGVPEFVPIEGADDRSANAARRMAERFGTCGGGVGQVYDQNSKAFETVVKAQEVTPEISRRRLESGRDRESSRGEKLAKHWENKGQKRKQADVLRRRPVGITRGSN